MGEDELLVVKVQNIVLRVRQQIFTRRLQSPQIASQSGLL